MTTERKQISFRVSKGDPAKCPESMSHAVDMTVKVTLPADHVLCRNPPGTSTGNLAIQALERTWPDLEAFPFFVGSEWRFLGEAPDTLFHATLVNRPNNSDPTTAVSLTEAVSQVADRLLGVLKDPDFLTAVAMAAGE